MDRHHSWEKIIHSLSKGKIGYIVFQTNLGMTYVKNLELESDYDLSFQYVNDPDSHEIKGWKVCKTRSKAEKYKESFMSYKVESEKSDEDSITLSDDDNDSDEEECKDVATEDSCEDVKKNDASDNSMKSENDESDSDFNEGENSMEIKRNI
jgi:hypothetical protein